MLFQDFNIHPHLTVKENIHLGKSNEKFDFNRMIKAVQSVNADEFIKKYPKEYEQVLSEKYAGGNQAKHRSMAENSYCQIFLQKFAGRRF